MTSAEQKAEQRTKRQSLGEKWLKRAQGPESEASTEASPSGASLTSEDIDAMVKARHAAGVSTGRCSWQKEAGAKIPHISAFNPDIGLAAHAFEEQEDNRHAERKRRTEETRLEEHVVSPLGGADIADIDARLQAHRDAQTKARAQAAKNVWKGVVLPSQSGYDFEQRERDEQAMQTQRLQSQASAYGFNGRSYLSPEELAYQNSLPFRR